MRAGLLLGLLGSAEAVIQGFNYGSTFTDGSAKVQSDYEAEFARAQDLQGTSGFNSARLYTMIQAGTTDTPISAIPAAIDTNTGLLLGMWASAGQDDFDNELAALTSAISQYGTSFTSLIQGISVGSEDLYRISPTGIENDSGAGADPATIVSYISQVRSAIAGTAASGALVGHVDTWTAWVNGSNDAVINAVDWIGFDGYPYFQNTQSNAIGSAQALFQESLAATVAVAGAKPVWVTETGWPVSGPTENLAVASVANAQTYWDEVGCSLFGVTNTWWYTIQDAYPTTPSPSFGIIGTTLSSAPLYNLTCSGSASSSSSSSSTSSTTAITSAASATAPGTAVGSSTIAVVQTPGVEASASVSASTSASTATAATQSTGTTASASAAASTAEVTTITMTTYLPLESCLAMCSNTASTLASGSASTTSTQTTTLSTKTTTTSTSTTSMSTGTSVSMSTSSSSSTSTPMTTATSSTTSASMASSVTTSSSSSTACATNLSGAYQYPHLIVPVDSSKPTTALGTSYNGTLSSTVSTIFNFDIPSSYSGETCSLVFLFPELSQLETSSYTWNGEGGITVSELSSVATTSTTYDTVPSVSVANFGSISSLQAGNGYVINTFSCPAGQAVAFEFAATGGLSLNFFEDYNPSPLGAYITSC